MSEPIGGLSILERLRLLLRVHEVCGPSEVTLVRTATIRDAADEIEGLRARVRELEVLYREMLERQEP